MSDTECGPHLAVGIDFSHRRPVGKEGLNYKRRHPPRLLHTPEHHAQRLERPAVGIGDALRGKVKVFFIETRYA